MNDFKVGDHVFTPAMTIATVVMTSNSPYIHVSSSFYDAQVVAFHSAELVKADKLGIVLYCRLDQYTDINALI